MAKYKSKTDGEKDKAYQEGFDARMGERRLKKWAQEIREEIPSAQLNRKTAKNYEGDGHIGGFEAAGKIYVAIGDYASALDSLQRFRELKESRPTYHDPRAPNEEMRDLDSKIDALEAVVNRSGKRRTSRTVGIVGGILLIVSILFSASNLTGFAITESVSWAAGSVIWIVLFVLGLVLTYSFLRSRRN